MTEASALDLESRIKQLPGVLGCVILTSSQSGAPEEIQAFIQCGGDRAATQHAIYDEAFNHGVHEYLRQVVVFDL